MADRRTRLLEKLAAKYGYTATTGGKHMRLAPIPPKTGSLVIASISPKNVDHWLRNVESDLIKATKNNC